MKRVFISLSVVALLAMGMFWTTSDVKDLQPSQPEQVFSAAKSTRSLDEQTRSPTHRPIAQLSDGFTGSEACKDCHEAQFTSWHASYHRRMTQVATPESVIGRFDSKPVVAHGKSFALSQRGEEYWVNASELGGKQDSSTSNCQIVMTTGSHHMQIYWYSIEQGRSLAQLPVAWLNATHSWVPTSSLFISPPPQPLDLGIRRWNEVCIKCHTTNGQPRIQGVDSEQPQVDTLVAEFGISCEACHGPGEAHVAQQLAPASNFKDFAIVHPGKIDHLQSSQICGQCHGNWLPDSDAGLEDYLAHGTCFRAGDDLTEKRHVFGVQQPKTDFIHEFLDAKPHYLEDRYWADGMIRVSGGEYNGMVKSPCFQSSSMSCLSCHQLHQTTADPRTAKEWANDQLRFDRLGQESCLQCHEFFRAESQQTAHSHHPFGSSGNECQNCHMPHTSYGLLKAIRSHQISIPSVTESVQVGRPNACNQCHLDKSLAWTGTHLESWYGIETPDLTNDQRQYSATALWALTGDAGQRALAAASLGWDAAQDASRTDWVGAVIAQLLADPYDAVRHIAHRSLQTLPDFEAFEFNYAGPQAEHRRAAVQAFGIWAKTKKQASEDNATVLLTPTGSSLTPEFSRLNHARDNRQVLLAE